MKQRNTSLLAGVLTAHVRDFGLDHGYIADSLETSMPWNRVEMAVVGVKKRIVDACRRRGVGKCLSQERMWRGDMGAFGLVPID